MSDIVSSTGGLGLEPRSYDRLQFVPEQAPASAAELGEMFSELVDTGHAKDVGRVTLKTVVSPETATALFSGAFPGRHLEAAAPIAGEAGQLLVYLAQNEGDRQQTVVPRSEMLGRIASDIRVAEATPQPSPLERAQSLAKGLSFTDTIAEGDISRIAELWGPTFEWDAGGVGVLMDRLRHAEQSPGSRDVWFCGLKDRKGQIVSLAMAERLGVPGPNGVAQIVESTEWTTASDHRRLGYSDAVIGMLNHQILQSEPNATIIAECNYQTGAHRVGLRSGFEVPLIPPDNQPGILVGNVSVSGSLADFTLVDLPPAAAAWHAQHAPAMNQLITRSTL